MSRQSPKLELFRPLMDWWVVLLVVVLLLILLASIPYIGLSSLSAWQRGVMVIVISAIILYIIDIAFFSYYVLDEDGLVIASQLRHLFIPYRDIQGIKPGGVRGLISFRSHKRFALSSRLFVLNIRGSFWKSISVSPAHRDLFINHLLEHIDVERSSRATVVQEKKTKK